MCKSNENLKNFYFVSIDISKIKRIFYKKLLTSNKENLKVKNVIVGMEPTGHYWKPLANYLSNKNIKIVMVNSFHVKKVKEIDDKFTTKNDKKDALTIARLIKDGRYNDVYIP